MPHLTDQLTAYLDGTLTPEEAAAVAAHLAECAECRGTLDDLQAVRNLLRAVSSRAPHPSLLPRTLARIDAAARRSAAPRWIIAIAAVAGAAALLMQVRLLPSPHPDRAAGIWYFQQHAEFTVLHPMGDLALASYLSSMLPYDLLRPAGSIDGP